MMHTVHFHLGAAGVTWLKREAKRLEITVAELLRRLIDAARSVK